MFDQIENTEFEDFDGTSKPSPLDLYRSEVRPYAKNGLRKLAATGNVVDLNATIKQMISVCTRNCAVAQNRCADDKARTFVRDYVTHYMADDMFVARMRVGMLQHLAIQMETAASDPTAIERLLHSATPDHHTQRLAGICNAADHYAMRVALIRSYVGDAIIRVLCESVRSSVYE
jgi:hypothetical protein